MRRLPPLASIRAFEAAARAEEFHRSSCRARDDSGCGFIPGKKSLEERLGAPLFLREKGRVRLTSLGLLRLLPAAGECVRHP